MSSDQKEAIRRLLDEYSILTLATSSDEGPWAASVFFASDADLNLYFVSDERTRHARELLANEQVMVAMNDECRRWHDVKGLQIRGRGMLVADEERAAALRIFLAKFADIRAIFDLATSADERAIAKRLRETSFFRIVPEWVRIIDGSRGFGFTQEIDL